MVRRVLDTSLFIFPYIPYQHRHKACSSSLHSSWCSNSNHPVLKAVLPCSAACHATAVETQKAG